MDHHVSEPDTIPDSMRLDIRYPAPVTAVAELAVTCGETYLVVARAHPDAARGSTAYRDWAVFAEQLPGKRRRLTSGSQLDDYDSAVSRAMVMAGERERARLWREALAAKVGEEPDD